MTSLENKLKEFQEYMEHYYALKYVYCPEGELQEDYPKRVLRAEGFCDAMNEFLRVFAKQTV